MSARTNSRKNRATRFKVAKAGIIQFGERSINCLVRCLSETGAGMDIINSKHSIPYTFELLIPGDGLKQSCRLVWRKDHRLGVAFIF